MASGELKELGTPHQPEFPLTSMCVLLYRWEMHPTHQCSRPPYRREKI